MFGLGIIDRVANRYLDWRQRPQNATLENPDLLFRRSVGSIALTGVSVTEEHVIGVSTAFACIQQIAQALATSPVDLYETLPEGGKRKVVGDQDIALANVVRSKPNEENNSLDLRLSVTAGLVLYRNGFCQVRRNRMGGVVELVPIHPRDVEIVRDEMAPLSPMGRKPLRYRLTGISDPLDRRDVLHLKGLSFDGMGGLPMTQVARESLGLAIALDRNASAFFGNSSRPGLIFEHPGALSDDGYNRLLEGINAMHSGVDNAYKAFIAEEGMKVQRANSENRDSQFDESRERQALEIARFFGVPPHKVGILNSEPRANIEEQNLEFVTSTVEFYCEIWRQALNHSILTDEQRNRGLFFDFDLEKLISGNLKDRADAYRIGGDLSCITKDELRQRVYGLNPLPDEAGKELILPPNVKRPEEIADEP
jgi:HK97 family phage portal protein